MKTREFYFLVSVKLRNDWNEWTVIPLYALTDDMDASLEYVARKVRLIVDHRGEDTVKVEMYNRETKLHDQEFVFTPVKF